MKKDKQVDPFEEKTHGCFQLWGGSGKEQWTTQDEQTKLHNSPNYAVAVGVLLLFLFYSIYYILLSTMITF